MIFGLVSKYSKLLLLSVALIETTELIQSFKEQGFYGVGR